MYIFSITYFKARRFYITNIFHFNSYFIVLIDFSVMINVFFTEKGAYTFKLLLKSVVSIVYKSIGGWLGLLRSNFQ